MSDTEGPYARSDRDEDYGYCNSCGEEMWIADECCEDGEWVPANE